MPMLLVDGPDKAGKTSGLAMIAARWKKDVGHVIQRHWGPIISDTQYAAPQAMDTASALDPHTLVLWDRAWPAEYVYGNLLGRERPLGFDPWLAQWLYGRSLQSVGLSVINIGPHESIIKERRDRSDPPIQVEDLRDCYLHWGKQYADYIVGEPDTPINNHLGATLWDDNVQSMLIERLANWRFPRVAPPILAGPADAKVVFLGEQGPSDGFRWLPNEVTWGPWNSPYTRRMARILGNDAFKCQWTNARNLRETDAYQSELFGDRYVVAAGLEAAGFASMSGATGVLNVPHPAALYRWGRYREDIPGVEARIVEFVRGALGS